MHAGSLLPAHTLAHALFCRSSDLPRHRSRKRAAARTRVSPVPPMNLHRRSRSATSTGVPDVANLTPGSARRNSGVKTAQPAVRAAAQILAMLRKFGRIAQAMAAYDCRRVLKLAEDLSEEEYRTGWVLNLVRRS